MIKMIAAKCHIVRLNALKWSLSRSTSRSDGDTALNLTQQCREWSSVFFFLWGWIWH